MTNIFGKVLNRQLEIDKKTKEAKQRTEFRQMNINSCWNSKKNVSTPSENNDAFKPGFPP